MEVFLHFPFHFHFSYTFAFYLFCLIFVSVSSNPRFLWDECLSAKFSIRATPQYLMILVRPF